MNKKEYYPMMGIEARNILNALGYKVRRDDEVQMVMLGMIVSLAKEIEQIKQLLEAKK